MKIEITCPQCGKENEIIIRCNNVICLACGYEETKDLHFARLLADAILAQARDGLDRSGYLVEMALAYENASFLLDIEP